VTGLCEGSLRRAAAARENRDMSWRWRARWTPKRSAPHEPVHLEPASTRITIVIAIVVLAVVIALVRWYSR